MSDLSIYLPTVLELSLSSFGTLAAQTALEIIDFLSDNPSPSQVAAYTVSERAQERMRHLLALNEAGVLLEEEQRELDEMEQIEHVMVLLKAKARQRLYRTGGPRKDRQSWVSMSDKRTYGT